MQSAARLCLGFRGFQPCSLQRASFELQAGVGTEGSLLRGSFKGRGVPLRGSFKGFRVSGLGSWELGIWKVPRGALTVDGQNPA